MNKLIKVLFFVVSIVFSFSCTPPSEFKERPLHFQLLDKNKFYADPLVFFDADSLKPRLDLYIEIPAENIIFRINNTNNKYESKISIKINIKNFSGEPVLDKSFDEFASYYEEQIKKISKESHFYLYNFFIEPGSYKIEIKIKDTYSNIEYKKSTDFSVKNLNSPGVSFSSTMLISKYKITDDGTKEITPLISNNIFGLKEFFVFFEIFNCKDEEVSGQFIYRLKDNKNTVIKEDVLAYSLSPGKNKKTEKISISKELKKYIPNNPDFDLYLYDDEGPPSFTFEISDKITNEIVTSKKLNFFPNKIQPEMMNRHGRY
jgi:hypothetical protein